MAETNALLLDDSAIKRQLRYAKFRQESLTVAILNTNYHLIAECRRALERLGHRVVLIDVPLDRQEASMLVRNLLWALIEHRPDFILSINHIGFDEQGVIGHLLEEIELPIVVWYVDSPVFVLRKSAIPAKAMSSIFLWEKRFIRTMRQHGAEDVHYLPLATDPSMFATATATAPEAIYPVAFVGDSMQHAKQKWKNRLDSKSYQRGARLAKVLTRDLLMKHIEEASRDDSDESAEKCGAEKAGAEKTCSERKDGGRGEMATRWDLLAAATWEATAAYRLSILKKVPQHHLHLFGDEGWCELLPQAHFRGRLDYGAPLAEMYRSAAININMTSVQMATAVNQRVFDVPAASGFVLTDAQSDLFDHFEPEVEVVCYRDKNEVPALIKHYQANRSARQAIIERAQRRILNEHTYDHRIRRLLEVLFTRHAPHRLHNGARTFTATATSAVSGRQPVETWEWEGA